MGGKGSKEPEKKKEETKTTTTTTDKSKQNTSTTTASSSSSTTSHTTSSSSTDKDKEKHDIEDVSIDSKGADKFKGSADKNAEESSGGEESLSFWERNKTFRQPKDLKGGKQQKLHQTIKATMKATLGGGDLKKAVQLPDGEDQNEWIAVNTVHFYNAANMIYGTCAEFCTEDTCKSMTAGKNEYLWKDDDQYKKPTKVSAPKYIDLLLTWINDQISDPTLFPVDENAKFPRNFMSRVKDLYKRLFRLYAHIYYSHFEKICAIGAKAHLNTCFKHFIFFVMQFTLIDEKDLAPLKNFIDKFKEQFNQKS